MSNPEILSRAEQHLRALSQLAIENLPSLVFAIVIFFVGKWIAKWLTKRIAGLMRRSEVEEELVGFFESILYWILFVLVTIAALGQLGVPTASFIAMLGAAGLAIGLALQGSLSNFAAGVLLIILRPFRVGDFIDAAGESGSVESIKVFTTELRTSDNKCVFIPNSRVLEGNITNYSSTGRRRVDMVFGIAYDDNIDAAKSVIRNIIEADSRVLKEPEVLIAVSELADSSVNILVRPWVNTENYWPVYYETTEAVKVAFDEAGISIPFPQSTVRFVRD